MLLGETLPPRISESRSAVSLRHPMLQHTESSRGDVIAKILSNAQLPMDAPMRSKFQWFMSDPPCSSFKKLVVSAPRLLCNLHTMSLVKAVPNGLKDCKCKKIALRERPLIPYVPKKDCVQETVLSFKDNHPKIQIGEGIEL